MPHSCMRSAHQPKNAPSTSLRVRLSDMLLVRTIRVALERFTPPVARMIASAHSVVIVMSYSDINSFRTAFLLNSGLSDCFRSLSKHSHSAGVSLNVACAAHCSRHAAFSASICARKSARFASISSSRTLLLRRSSASIFAASSVTLRADRLRKVIPNPQAVCHSATRSQNLRVSAETKLTPYILPILPPFRAPCALQNHCIIAVNARHGFEPYHLKRGPCYVLFMWGHCSYSFIY